MCSSISRRLARPSSLVRRDERVSLLQPPSLTTRRHGLGLRTGSETRWSRPPWGSRSHFAKRGQPQGSRPRLSTPTNVLYLASRYSSAPLSPTYLSLILTPPAPLRGAASAVPADGTSGAWFSRASEHELQGCRGQRPLTWTQGTQCQLVDLVVPPNRLSWGATRARGENREKGVTSGEACCLSVA